MKKLYQVKKENNMWNVIELPTKLVVYSSKNDCMAFHYAGKLNSNKGFNGWTPMFFVKNENKIQQILKEAVVKNE